MSHRTDVRGGTSEDAEDITGTAPLTLNEFAAMIDKEPGHVLTCLFCSSMFARSLGTSTALLEARETHLETRQRVEQREHDIRLVREIRRTELALLDRILPIRAQASLDRVQFDAEQAAAALAELRSLIESRHATRQQGTGGKP